MLKTATLAWSFRCAHRLDTAKAALDAAWPSAWIELDSDSKQDSIGAKLTPHAAARMYRYGIDFFVVNVRVMAEDGELKARADEASQRLLEDALPLLGARDIKVCEPVDGM